MHGTGRGIVPVVRLMNEACAGRACLQHRICWNRSLSGGGGAIFTTNKHRELLVWALVVYIAFFAAVVWVYLSKIFPTRVRGKDRVSAPGRIG